MVQAGRNQPFVAAVRLVVYVRRRLVRELIEQPVQGRQGASLFQKREAIGGKECLDGIANRNQLVGGADFIPKIRLIGEFADGGDNRIRIGAEIGQIIEELLRDLLDLLVAAPEINVEPGFGAVVGGRYDNVLEARCCWFTKLLLFGEQLVGLSRKKRS